MGLIRWDSGRARIEVRNALLVLAGLVVSSVGSGQTGWPGITLLAVGLLLAGGASWRVLGRAAGDDGQRFRMLLAFVGLCLVFFGGDGLIPLAVIAGLGRSVIAASITMAAGRRSRWPWRRSAGASPGWGWA